MSRASSATSESPNNKKDDKAQSNEKGETATVDEQEKKTRFKAYLTWTFFWWCGFPHWYLGRTTHAVLIMTTVSEFGMVVALADLFNMHFFVDQANGEWCQKGLGYNPFDGVLYLLVSHYYERKLSTVMDETPATFIGVFLSAYICLGLGRKRFDPIGVPTTLSLRMALFWFLVIFGVYEDYVFCRFALALCQSVRPESDPPSGKSGLLGRVITFLFVLMCMWAVGDMFKVESTGSRLKFGTLILDDLLYHLDQSLGCEGFERVSDGGGGDGGGGDGHTTTVWGNAYKTLELDPFTATPADVKKQWKSLVRKYHPDRAPDEPPETLAKINQAYETLSRMYLLSGSKETEDTE